MQSQTNAASQRCLGVCVRLGPYYAVAPRLVIDGGFEAGLTSAGPQRHAFIGATYSQIYTAHHESDRADSTGRLAVESTPQTVAIWLLRSSSRSRHVIACSRKLGGGISEVSTFLFSLAFSWLLLAPAPPMEGLQYQGHIARETGLPGPLSVVACDFALFL